MAVHERDVSDSIVQYQIEIHRSIRKQRMCVIERKIRRGFDQAKKTFSALGLCVDALPYPRMDNYIAGSGRAKILEGIKSQKSASDQISIEEETRKVYEDLCKKAVPKVHKVLVQNIAAKQAQHKKISTICQRELKRALTKTSKTNPSLKGKRVTKELQGFFKRAERNTREKRRKEEKEDYDRRKKEEEMREEQRQEKKLNFLITQTELFSHFILGKKGRPEEETPEAIIAQKAAERHRQAVMEYDAPGSGGQTVYNNSTLPISETVSVPGMLQCTLKDYQKRGLEWLVSLYDQGINGMLADEMGLGKTVQGISFLAHLAENEGIWGPFLIITPASTLHNWEQEFAKFVPAFKVVSYWGTVAERKALRRSWQQRKLQREDSPFHVVITSYQLAVSDEKYFSKVKWQYMILDEAQAIKSSSSTRWKTLLSFKARSRLLLTGTPIQNTLQELWALLHFIMPTLFDSHGEFSEWFRIEDGDSVTEAARLRMVLQPFMLRREKKDVADELGMKVEKTIVCEMSPKQRKLYEGIRARAPMATFLDRGIPDGIEGIEGLMNLVMQFRKVCNHPDLFEKREVSSGWSQPVSEAYIPKIVNEEILVEKWAPVGLRVPEKRISDIFRVEPEKIKRIKKTDFIALSEIVVPRCLPPKKVLVSPAYIHGGKIPLEISESLRQPPVYVPSMERFVSDCGKLVILDSLLPKLKEEGHRVLMYFQMTKMIDLFEEYLTVRNYSYLRLDGSSRISNRKELVRDWQSSSDKFIFLLSTRAGGLGINLTAADTVIFYDSDWNPTADQQAMDRAHRLGQTKQVTVYRLITAGTIEERIMERAEVKGEIQRMVIQTKDD
ncbi:chromatin-remodeling ATPase INO80 [Nematocida major]|uniref:chromatin-remodeling ATPase INO80 n=1 Tax=Nematocida major TaxID=1912982 RepID=UPI00200799A4|nr:chromatin-remodeling ATPase INO80 [Nematocida major]KAH9385860.1 chromatin-remodeling ATPase INO80 [Nematocida major]